MKTYVDSSVLVAIYVPEQFSQTARQTVRAVPQIPFTQLHELEVRNAFESLVGRGLVTRDECRAILGSWMETWRASGSRASLSDLDRVFTSASDLSRTYIAKVLTRSLDLLHVAAALAMVYRLVSADDRQLVVAKAAGLTVADVKRRVRRERS